MKLTGTYLDVLDGYAFEFSQPEQAEALRAVLLADQWRQSPIYDSNESVEERLKDVASFRHPETGATITIYFAADPKPGKIGRKTASVCLWTPGSVYSATPLLFPNEYSLVAIKQAVEIGLKAQLEARGEQIGHRGEQLPAVSIESLKEVAYARLREVPAGMAKEDYLPFVEAMCRYLDAQQNAALDADETGRSFSIANEQLQYWGDYRRLTNNEWK